MRILLILVLLSLTACPPKKPTEPAGDATTAAAGDPKLPSAPREPLTECAGEPAWLAWTPCRSPDGLYVSAKVSGLDAMARTRAMNRARAALARLGIGEQAAGRVTLHNSEALDSFVCNEETWGLTRWSGEAPDLEVADCTGVTLLDDAADGDCPAWTRRGAWREGDAVMAVGAVRGVKNPSLARTTARNRAMAEAGKLHAVTIAATESGVSASTMSVHRGIASDVHAAECDGVLYLRLKLEMP
jgi:hypothetical protein